MGRLKIPNIPPIPLSQLQESEAALRKTIKANMRNIAPEKRTKRPR